MGTFFLLAGEAEHSGFGLNSDILDTNLINLVIIIGVLFYFGKKSLGKTLSDRQAQIQAAIKEAEQRKERAASALAEQQQKLAQAQSEATRIRAEAEERADAVRATIMAQSEEDIQRMKAAAAQDLTTQQDRVLNELRQRVAALATQKAEEQLRAQMNPDAQRHLIDRSIASIGGA
ncbi:MAG: F0F1 ATP synthase subunit B [Cyanobacteria bacterium RM1_2_2]|nr:F0F1 ATP synthase subunit B [Cyanobacteria bacterium RM1_2_2]